MDSNEIVREFRYTVPAGATPEQAEQLKVEAGRRAAEQVCDELLAEARRRLFPEGDDPAPEN
jgi:hypothetical protein